MRRLRRYSFVLATLVALLAAPYGTAWAGQGSGTAGTAGLGDFVVAAWKAAPPAAAPETADGVQAAVDRGTCFMVPGAGIKITMFCEIKVSSRLWVYCRGVTIEIPLPPGRWAPSGSCPGYLGYELTA